jgi:ABC-type bacteriocin/lantibiotic exporter with double-glycine peptidase domain
MKRQRVRGGIFAANSTAPYLPRGVLLGQQRPESCVPACCRMLLFDFLPDARGDHHYSESSLRSTFHTNEQGSSLAMIVDVLRSNSIPLPYRYSHDVTAQHLQAATRTHPAVVIVRKRGYPGGHALIVDGMDEASVLLRDPLPESEGSAYALPLSDFLLAWLNPQSGCGTAVLVLE